MFVIETLLASHTLTLKLSKKPPNRRSVGARLAQVKTKCKYFDYSC